MASPPPPVCKQNQDMIQSLVLARTMATTVSKVQVVGKKGHIGLRSVRGYGNLFVDCVDTASTQHGTCVVCVCVCPVCMLGPRYPASCFSLIEV